MPMTTRLKHLVAAILILPLVACQSPEQSAGQTGQQDSALTIESIFKDKEFKSDSIGQIRWLKDGSGYTQLEDSPNET